MGSFEAPVVVPELKQAPMKVSSVVLSTQLQPAPKAKTDNPLVRDGVQLLPNLTHVVGKDQKLFFYYEVYDPAPARRHGAAAAHQPGVLPRQGEGVRNAGRRADDDRRAGSRRRRSSSSRCPPASFTPGLYTCQINIIDAVAGKFEFPRMLFAVR